MRVEAALGVAHRRGAVAVERAEIAGAVDQRIAQRERLRHAHQRFVERHVAVRVVAAHHVADDLGALAVLGVGGEVLLPHRVEDAALHRLQPVADVGQRARRDHRQRVVQIARLRRFVQRDVGGAAGAAAGRRRERLPLPAPAGSRLSKRSGVLRFAIVRYERRPAVRYRDLPRIGPQKRTCRVRALDFDLFYEGRDAGRRWKSWRPASTVLP